MKNAIVKLGLVAAGAAAALTIGGGIGHADVDTSGTITFGPAGVVNAQGTVKHWESGVVSGNPSAGAPILLVNGNAAPLPHLSEPTVWYNTTAAAGYGRSMLGSGPVHR